MTSEGRPDQQRSVERTPVRQTIVDYGRGMGGGLVIGTPLLLTMEMWWSGFYMPPLKMLLFFGLNFLVLLILEYYSGFREERNLAEEVNDAVVALGFGIAISAAILFVLSVLGADMSLYEISGKIIVESIPVSIGFSVAASQLGQPHDGPQRKKLSSGFWGTQAVALAGAVVFGFNIAPTEEPMMLGLRMDWWHSLALVLISITQVYVIVYAVSFRGSRPLPEQTAWWRVFLRVSTTSYVIALLVGAYLLWTFGRIDPDTGVMASIQMIVTLGFVTSLGAAVGKLIL